MVEMESEVNLLEKRIEDASEVISEKDSEIQKLR